MRNLTACFAALLLVILATTGCDKTTRHKQTVPSEDEERIFTLVFQPNYEGRYADAISAADSLMDNCEMSDSLRAFIMIERNVALMNSGDMNRGFANADTLIRFGRKSGVNEAVIQGLVTKGLCYRRNAELDSAITNYKTALDIATADGSTEWEQAIVEYLAIAYTEANRIEEGYKFSERALELAKQMNDTAAIMQSVGTLAGSLAKSDNYHRTLTELNHYRPLIAIAPPTIKVKILTPLFHTYLKLDSIPQARETLRQMEETSADFPSNHYQAVIVKLCRAKLYGAEGRYADEYAIYTAVDSIGTIGRQSEDLFLEKAICLSHLGRADEAFTLMRDAYAALDSTRRSSVQKDLSDLAVKYDTLTKELEIERLANQRWVMLFGLLASIIIIVAIIALFIHYRSKSRRKLEHERREQYIQGLEEERGRIARELHDDIAGQLIGLQWELPGITKDEASERILGIGQRVRTLSHEMMPPEFANRTFCQLLFDFTANVNRRHPQRRVTLSDEGSYNWNELSDRQSYELYRMVQEAVNNALKHSENGDISITLGGDDRFSMTISNECRRPMPEQESQHAGTATLRTRAEIIGAEVSVRYQDNNYILTILQR